MSVEARASVEQLPRHAGGTRSTSWWGMLWLIATEAMLFASLIASYFYLRFQSAPEWPPDGIAKPELALPFVMSAILLGSSIPMHVADAGIRKSSLFRLKAGLLLSFVLGATFVGLQAYEYVELLREFTPRTNVYGSLFFTITGFHGLHVVGGLLLNVWTQGRAWAGHFDAERHVQVQTVAMYWHFVDVVWVFILLSLYISPHL